MHVTYDTTTRQIIQYGTGLGAPDGYESAEIDDALLDTLRQPGIKTFNPDDGTITVSPDLAAQAAEQARQDAIADAAAKRKADSENIMKLFPNATPDQVASFASILGITLT